MLYSVLCSMVELSPTYFFLNGFNFDRNVVGGIDLDEIDLRSSFSFGISSSGELSRISQNAVSRSPTSSSSSP
jgi:hypothetical protein